MALFSNIKLLNEHNAILEKVRANLGDWSTTAAGVSEYRDLLLGLQNWRCVYCQAPIERHANGYRELDHILPKNPSHRASLPKAHSENREDRKVTFGYPEFTFEPLNLVIACKECNNQKGTFDPLKNRTRKIVRFPAEKNFLWFHPHYHTYSNHIRFNENCTFTRESDQGENVIEACGLADSEGLKRRFLSQAQSIVGRTKGDGLKESVRTLALNIVQRNISIEQAASALSHTWQFPLAEAIALIAAWKSHFENDDDSALKQRANRALEVVTAKVARIKRSS